MSANKRKFKMSQLHKKLENDQCFDYDCTHESRWKIRYLNEDGLRTETRLCDRHADELLIGIKRPWVVVSL